MHHSGGNSVHRNHLGVCSICESDTGFDVIAPPHQVSEAKALASLRDIPPVAGKILWARQMERQLRLLSMRLSDVLGEGWENHVDGRHLKAVCDELLRNLDTKRYVFGRLCGVCGFLLLLILLALMLIVAVYVGIESPPSP